MVTSLLDNIVCSDPYLLSGMANVKADPNKMNNFEDAVAELLKYCPIRKKQNNIDCPFGGPNSLEYVSILMPTVCELN